MIRKKGQEEAVGFVAIIVIVALAVVFFIGINLRSTDQVEVRSVSVKQFLESSAAYTSNCDLGSRDKYASMRQLIESCSRNPETRCFDGSNVCSIYSVNMQNLLNKGWRVDADSPIQGYILNISYSSQTSDEHILSLVNGTCERNFISEETLSLDTFRGGTFVTSLKICY